jgi:hypothetical protein
MKKLLITVLLLFSVLVVYAKSNTVYYHTHSNRNMYPYEISIKELKIRANYKFNCKYLDYLQNHFEYDSEGIEITKDTIKLSIQETKRFLIKKATSELIGMRVLIIIGIIFLLIVVFGFSIAIYETFFT